MRRGELLGSHLHTTSSGVGVHVWMRGGLFLARGSYLGSRFGVTLDSNPAEAGASLCRLLTEIEDGSFVRPSEARHRPLSKGKVPRLTLRELTNEFLAEKRQLRGQKTAGDYSARLMPILAFAEKSAMRKRWPLAASLDHEFAVLLRAFLHGEWRTTRNGRAGAALKSLSSRQIHNVLDCLRSIQ